MKLGDKIGQADGTTGTVRLVKTVEQTKTMYNLDVANLDNFYVGEQGWLVHNGNKYGFDFQTDTGVAADFAGKGYHINSSKLGEIKIAFAEGVMNATTLNGTPLNSRELNALNDFLSEHSGRVTRQLEAALQHTASSTGLSGTNLRNLAASRAQAQALIKALAEGCLE